MRVVLHQNSRVDSEFASDGLNGIVLDDHVSVFAILVFVTNAQFVANDQIATLRVNNTGVDGSKLVTVDNNQMACASTMSNHLRRDILGSTNQVTVVVFLRKTYQGSV